MSSEYLGRGRRWGIRGARGPCPAGQQRIVCLTRLDPAFAAILLVVACPIMAFTAGLKRLLFAPTITRTHRGTPGPCWGLLHRDADATTAARQPARAATTTVDRQPSGMYLQLSSSHPAPSCSCRIMCAILQLYKIERRFSSCPTRLQERSRQSYATMQH